MAMSKIYGYVRVSSVEQNEKLTTCKSQVVSFLIFCTNISS